MESDHVQCDYCFVMDKIVLAILVEVHLVIISTI